MCALKSNKLFRVQKAVQFSSVQSSGMEDSAKGKKRAKRQPQHKHKHKGGHRAPVVTVSAPFSFAFDASAEEIKASPEYAQFGSVSNNKVVCMPDDRRSAVQVCHISPCVDISDGVFAASRQNSPGD